MDKIHEEEFTTNKWEPIGTFVKHNKEKYISDCIIDSAVNIDTIRMYMYSNKELEEYIPGKATSKELLDALKYSYKYFGIDMEEVKIFNKVY